MRFHPYSGGLNSKYDLKYCSFSGYKTEINEPQHDKTNKITCAPSEDSEQPGNPPSLIRVFVVGLENWVLSYPLSAKQRLWSDWADAQTDLSLRWAHCQFVGFVSCCDSI